MANTLGFQLYTLKQFEGGYEAAFEAVKEMGVTHIEAWCGAVPSDPGSEAMSMNDMRAALDRNGLKLACGHLAIVDFDERYEEWRDLLLDYGSKHWVVPFAKPETLDEWLALLPKFEEMNDRMKGDGLKLGYHNHHMELEMMEGKYVFEHLLDGMPELNAQFHIAQFLPKRGIDLPSWIKKYEGRVCSLHVNDADAEGNYVPLGSGACKCEESIKTALDTGVDTYIVEIMLTSETSENIKLCLFS